MAGALEAFPEVRLRDGFAAHAAACRARGALDEHAADLFLAWAAARGDPAAVRRFDLWVLPDIEAAARRVDRQPAFVDEVRQRVHVRLLVASGAPPRMRLDDYAGRGPLRGWVGVTALRVALDLKREAGPRISDEEVLGELVGAEPDAELRHLKTQYRAEFRAALEEALAALPARARVMLRVHFVDGLRLAQIARLYGVHESTVSRWLAQAAEAVADDARTRLVRRLSLSPSTVDSVARMVHSCLDLSIARLLATR